MPEKRGDDNRRKARVEIRGRFGSGPQAGALYDLVNDDPRLGVCRIPGTDQAETVKRGDLFGYGAGYAKALEASAERLQRGYGTFQSSPPGLRRKVVAIRKRRPRNRDDKGVVVEWTRRQAGPCGLDRNRTMRAVSGRIEQVRLSVWHGILAPGVQSV
jgi:hypothetical protein